MKAMNEASEWKFVSERKHYGDWDWNIYWSDFGFC